MTEKSTPTSPSDDVFVCSWHTSSSGSTLIKPERSLKHAYSHPNLYSGKRKTDRIKLFIVTPVDMPDREEWV